MASVPIALVNALVQRHFSILVFTPQQQQIQLTSRWTYQNVLVSSLSQLLLFQLSRWLPLVNAASRCWSAPGLMLDHFCSPFILSPWVLSPSKASESQTCVSSPELCPKLPVAQSTVYSYIYIRYLYLNPNKQLELNISKLNSWFLCPNQLLLLESCLIWLILLVKPETKELPQLSPLSPSPSTYQQALSFLSSKYIPNPSFYLHFHCYFFTSPSYHHLTLPGIQLKLPNCSSCYHS